MNYSVKELRSMANTIRRDIIDIAYKAQGPSHPAPALSCADIVTALYFNIMNIDPNKPGWDERDRLVLSKGHACPVLYSALAELGYFPKDWLWTIRHIGSRLQGHPDMKKTPGVDATSGSLGNGLPIALGMALYIKHQGKASQVYCILGDGECQEGTVWEAVMAAPALGADNLTAIVDFNHLQSCGSVVDIMHIPNISKAWDDMGWNVMVINGHNMSEILSALETARDYRGKPTCIIANTVKGKGISFMEHDNSWHQKIPTQAQYEQALRELEEERVCL